MGSQKAMHTTAKPYHTLLPSVDGYPLGRSTMLSKLTRKWEK